MRKEVKDHIRFLQARGWFIKRQTGTGHIMMHWPPGGSITFPSTPSDWHWNMNSIDDSQRIEAQYGPYVPEPKTGERISDMRGFDYVKPTLVVAPKSVGVAMKAEPLGSTSVIIKPMSSTRENAMSNQDREIILQILQEKSDALYAKVSPYLTMVEEYQRIASVLKNMGRAHVPDEEKIKEFLDKKKPAKEVKYVGRDTILSDIKEIMGDEGKIALKDLNEWLSEVKGYGFESSGITPITGLVRKIKELSKNNPRLILGPGPKPGDVRVKKYEYVEYK